MPGVHHRLQADRGPRAVLSACEGTRWGRGGWGGGVRPSGTIGNAVTSRSSCAVWVTASSRQSCYNVPKACYRETEGRPVSVQKERW